LSRSATAALQQCDLGVIFGEIGARCGDHSRGIESPEPPMHAATALPIRRQAARPVVGIAATAELPPSLPLSMAEVVAHRAYLVRFAARRLRDPMLAEDAVHDVFEAVLSGRASFGGRAALRSWLTAVLKNKIVDAMRRSPHHETLDDDEEGTGSARHLVCPRAGPEEIAEQRQRLGLALAGIEALPRGLRDAMRLRVLEERSTDAVCGELGISEENLFVRVHRARKHLLS
jgi:RNA polymerase sigma-70 factor (ECF subfamily)